MASEPQGRAARAPDPPAKRLDSWKEIAAYLKRDVRTVRRWEAAEGLPVHRHLHTQRGSVYAYKAELDTWLAARGSTIPLHEPARSEARRGKWAFAGVLVALAALGLVLMSRFYPTGEEPAADPSPVPGTNWIRLTSFEESATSPALSPDGQLLAFIRGPGTFYSAGEIYVKPLPDGPAVQLTNHPIFKMSPAFSPDGSRIAYTTVDLPTFAWDTWVVPVVGGEARPLLRNASGLTWIADGRVLFSEIKQGTHMALVTATERRAQARDVYVPHTRTGGMAHRSALSPDRRWVLVAEMDEGWIPCRLVPADGSSEGMPVGPPRGGCTSVAWSPDGEWMYMTSDASGQFHIWRQRFPNGVPEQLTVGPTEEEGLAVAPDGRSLITSVGIREAAVWVHGPSGDRQVSAEGEAFLPAFGRAAFGSYFSADGRLYYLVRRSPSSAPDAGELWAVDLRSGRTAAVLSGVAITGFDISSDGSRVVYASPDSRGRSRIWIGSLQNDIQARPFPVSNAESPLFAGPATIVFRARDDEESFIYRIREDGEELVKVTPDPTGMAQSASPDGQWVAARTTSTGEKPGVVLAFSLRGGSPRRICRLCYVQWDRSGDHFYVTVPTGDHEPGSPEISATGGSGGWKTFVVRLPSGESLPDFGPGGIRSVADLERIGIVDTIERRYIAPGPTAGIYAYAARMMRRNLYRIPLEPPTTTR